MQRMNGATRFFLKNCIFVMGFLVASIIVLLSITSSRMVSAPSPPVNELAHQCPDYFKWIHEDYRPWRETGVTREVLEQAKPGAHFRVIILKGRVYVETYSRCFQTRDVFTQWGILQLLSRYPGRVPDLELLFNCEDLPTIPWPSNASAAQPAALFHYCGDDTSADIVFPDWSFWGWAEVNIKPWGQLLKEIKAENGRLQWRDREPYAFWKGNPIVHPMRDDLMKCNVTDKEDWNARLYTQDWGSESQNGFKTSNLATQCTHQYKIYIEGRAWSVSRKYILACDSLSLVVEPQYYDFFSRGLSPLEHFWPVRLDGKCPAIKYAVDWGKRHPTEVQKMGKMASSFMFEDVNMDRVYDYMLHTLTEYSRLLKFKPVIPATAVELDRSMLLSSQGELYRRFLLASEEKSSAQTPTCLMPHPMKQEEMMELLKKKIDATFHVRRWEKQHL